MSKNNGIVIGIVDDLEDPDNLARVRVTFPHLGNQQSQWARLATPMAGAERGFYMVPEVGDEVLVGFLQGDIRFPYILGSLWSTADKPPASDGKPKENNWRFIKSRSGHIIRLDDTSGKEKIEVIDKNAKHKIVIDVAGDKIQILCDSGDVEVKATAGSVKVEANSVEVKASSNISLEATGNISLEATGSAAIKGATIDINATGPITVAGTPIKLN